jgi:hypothetical protein
MPADPILQPGQFAAEAAARVVAYNASLRRAVPDALAGRYVPPVDARVPTVPGVPYASHPDRGEADPIPPSIGAPAPGTAPAGRSDTYPDYADAPATGPSGQQTPEGPDLVRAHVARRHAVAVAEVERGLVEPARRCGTRSKRGGK